MTDASPGPMPALRVSETDVRTGDAVAALPQLLVSLLERRYLSDFQHARWRMTPGTADGTRPVLREILGIGRELAGESWSQAMPHVLTATHSLGQAVVMVMYGDGQRHRFFLGGRRLPHLAQGSTEDFLDGQGSVLHAHIPGMDLGDPGRMDRGSSADVSEFLRAAPAVAVVTGVPSPRRGPESAVFQNIDRLTAAAGSRRYAVVVVAEPLDAGDLDVTIDRCRRLISDVHGLVRRTASRTLSESESTTTTAPADEKQFQRDLSTALSAAALFCGVVGAIADPTRLPMTAMLFAAAGRQPHSTHTKSTGAVHSRTESGTVELLDANAEACEALLQRHIDRLENARSNGWWRTSVYVAAESDGALEAITGALRGICRGETATLEPVRVVHPPPDLIRTAATVGSPIRLQFSAQDMHHPLGRAFEALATCMTSDELSVLVTPPRREIPGLRRYQTAEFALSAPPAGQDSVPLGVLQDSAGRPWAPVHLSAASLNRHVLITGMTGYGKTTTAKRLLVQAYTTLDTPFLVIEPVKAEYRRLASHPALRGRLRVYTIGDDGGLPLRLNPFAPVENVPLLVHIDLLKAVFNASFPMFAGMSYVLEEAMNQIYEDRGWDLETSTNDALGPFPRPDDRTALTPSIADLHDKIEHVLQTRRYGDEVHQNLGAALRSRLHSLTIGHKGATLNTAQSVSATELFTKPCVIELKNLGDDEEKAFVMALLLCQLYEFAGARQSGTGGHDSEKLHHLTLIEEAHRLLRSPRAPGGPESPDAQAKAVEMFTNMLAEMRSYGEGFLVADQIPTKLAPEILKNTSVKILHRLVAPDDRAVVAKAVNLNDAQTGHLANLRPGVAIVHDADLNSAVQVRLTPLDTEPGGTRVPAPERTPDRSYLRRNAACHHCETPCTLLKSTQRTSGNSDIDRDLAGFFQALSRGDTDDAWRNWQGWRDRWRQTATNHGHPNAAQTGGIYCASSQAGHRWIGGVLLARNTLMSSAALTADQRLAQSRCARSVGTLCATWANADTLDTKAQSAFTDAHHALSESLTQRPPREMPGCAQCPVRCTMLPLVAPLLKPVGELIAHRATAPTSAATTIDSLLEIPDESFAATLHTIADPDTRSNFLYCAVTAATADDAAAPSDLLAALRTPTRPQ